MTTLIWLWAWVTAAWAVPLDVCVDVDVNVVDHAGDFWITNQNDRDGRGFRVGIFVNGAPTWQFADSEGCVRGVPGPLDWRERLRAGEVRGPGVGGGPPLLVGCVGRHPAEGVGPVREPEPDGVAVVEPHDRPHHGAGTRGVAEPAGRDDGVRGRRLERGCARVARVLRAGGRSRRTALAPARPTSTSRSSCQSSSRLGSHRSDRMVPSRDWCARTARITPAAGATGPVSQVCTPTSQTRSGRSPTSSGT
jgi:hypothetical protein